MRSGRARLGITAEAVAEIGLLPGKKNGFVDLAAQGSIMLPARPFAMVEGRESMLQLESPLAGLIVAQNTVLVDDPSNLHSNAECVASSWLVELDIGDDDEAIQEAVRELEAGGFVERPAATQDEGRRGTL